jgi:hypothetical protein
VTAPSAWQPCADGALAERSLEAGWLPDDLSAETTAALRASLASGRAGQSLLYAYLSFTGHGEDHADRALELLDEATDAVAATPMTDSLYSGFPGIAWVTDHAGGFRSWTAGLTGPQDWRDDRGFLEGAAGVGLALLVGGTE